MYDKFGVAESEASEHELLSEDEDDAPKHFPHNQYYNSSASESGEAPRTIRQSVYTNMLQFMARHNRVVKDGRKEQFNVGDDCVLETSDGIH